MTRRIAITLSALICTIGLSQGFASAATVDGVTATARWSRANGLVATASTSKGTLKRFAFRSNSIVTQKRVMTSLISKSGRTQIGVVTVTGAARSLTDLAYLGSDGVWPINLPSTTSPFVDMDFFGFGSYDAAPTDVLGWTNPLLTVRRRLITSPFTLDMLSRDWKLKSAAFSFALAPTAIAPSKCPSANSVTMRVERYGAAAVSVPLTLKC